MDKFGHAYGAYLMSYAGFKSLRWAGLSRSKTAIYGAGMGFLLQMPIEIWDGMYEGWGFSWSDVGAIAVLCTRIDFSGADCHLQIVILAFTLCKTSQWLFGQWFQSDDEGL